MRRTLTYASLAAIVCLSASCTSTTPGEPVKTTLPPFVTTTPEPMPQPSAGEPVDLNLVPQDAIDQIRSEVSAASPGANMTLTAERHTWTDGSLGCPQPGVAYTQALEDGFRVVATAGTKVYDYRIGRSGVPKLCKSVLPSQR